MKIMNLKLWNTGLLAGIMLGLWLQPQTAGATTRTVTSLNDSGPGSLRATIAASAAGDTIIFSVSGTITLSSGDLAVGRDLTITGPGAKVLTVSADHSCRVFSFYSGTVNLSGLTIAEGIRQRVGASTMPAV